MQQREILKQEKKAELREKRAQKMRELRQKKKDDRASAKAAILKEKADRKAARKAAAEAKRMKVCNLAYFVLHISSTIVS